MSPSPDRLNRQITLPDGRMLSYADVGDPAGRLMVLLHGTPSSRLDVVGLDAAASRTGWRLLAPDRPGHGGSSPQPGRSILDWPLDLLALVDEVTGDRDPAPIALLGFSGGAAYALATARLAPRRVSMVAIVSGWGPPDRPGAYGGVAWPEYFFDAMTRRVPAVTRAILGLVGVTLRRRPALARAILGADVRIEPLAESLRQGAAGPTDDLRLIVRPWGFPVGAIAVPTHLWHGDQDLEIPAHHAEFLARVVADVTLEIVAGADHRLLFSRADQILGALADRAGPRLTPGW
jgi:pimeloyl-ACP methyl ester carboxylesterase